MVMTTTTTITTVKHYLFIRIHRR